MNVIGFIRGMMSKNFSGEEFLKHVAKIMEMQLKEWDIEYEVMVAKQVNYEWVIKYKDQFYHTEISEGDPYK